MSGVLEEYYEIDIKDSWMYAAAEKNVPIVVPGWEDSTMGNIFASYVLKGELKASTMKSGIEYMTFLANWYTDNSENGIGFFQVGGGIAGRFSDLCSANVIPRYGKRRDPFLELFLPNFRFYYKLRVLFRSSPERKNYLGKIRY